MASARTVSLVAAAAVHAPALVVVQLEAAIALVAVVAEIAVVAEAVVEESAVVVAAIQKVTRAADLCPGHWAPTYAHQARSAVCGCSGSAY